MAQAKSVEVDSNFVVEKPAGSGGGSEEQTIEQVRELLFGQAQRANEKRTEQTAKRLADLEERLNQRLDRIEEMITDLAGTTEEERRRSIRELGKLMTALGGQIDELSGK